MSVSWLKVLGNSICQRKANLTIDAVGLFEVEMKAGVKSVKKCNCFFLKNIGDNNNYEDN